jgi:acetyl esterase/lipase
MKSIILRTLCAALFVASCAAAQETVPLYPGNGLPPNSTLGDYPEKAYFSKVWNADVVSNVTKPSLTVFKPSAATKNGTAAVICPGGGFVALSITSEGTDAAKYLTDRGVTTFVLKYRLAHTGEDATQEFESAYADREKFREMISKVVPQSIADGVAALAYVRQHAADYGVSPDKIGILGFSAGGSVAVGATLRDTPGASPAFLGAIYSAMSMFKDRPVPVDAPPIFIAAATDDNLGLAPDSTALYQKWVDAHKSAELHMYAKGGHGFGMHQHNIPTDHWIGRFTDWLELQGFLK